MIQQCGLNENLLNQASKVMIASTGDDDPDSFFFLDDESLHDADDEKEEEEIPNNGGFFFYASPSQSFYESAYETDVEGYEEDVWSILFSKRSLAGCTFFINFVSCVFAVTEKTTFWERVLIGENVFFLLLSL